MHHGLPGGVWVFARLRWFWVLIAEIFPNRLRSYAVAIATFALWGANFVVSLSFPYLLNNLKVGLFICDLRRAMCVFCLFFVLKYLEETKGKTLEEIELGLYSIRQVGTVKSNVQTFHN